MYLYMNTHMLVHSGLLPCLIYEGHKDIIALDTYGEREVYRAVTVPVSAAALSAAVILQQVRGTPEPFSI